MDAELVNRTLLGKLNVLRMLGSGGSGDVYEVEHLVTKHHRALKVLRRSLCESGEAVARLVREAAASSRVSTGFVVQAFDAGRIEDGRAYILMELVSGPTLARELERRGKLPEAEARELACELASGLSEVHGASMVHRDVKPSNIVLSKGGMRLLDFGLAKILADDLTAQETLTREGVLVGTPQYMAPEQFESKATVGASADIWAVGAILFEMLAGVSPYEGKTPAALAAAIHRAPAPLLRDLEPGVSPDLERVVARALEREPAKRHATMDELAAELRACEGPGYLPAGAIVDERFEVVRTVGRGGTGVVYEVRDRTNDTLRALKVLAPHISNRAGAAERVAREARLAAEVAHEHVVSVLETGRDEQLDAAYLVMPLCEGAALSEHLRARGRLPAAEVLPILRAIAKALDSIHARGIIHRDVKPGNILLGPDGTAQLADFGLAREVDAHDTATPTGVVLGTPLYMAPEQARRDVAIGPAADTYALAHVAFTLLVGRAYFEEDARAGILPLLGAIGRGVEEVASARARRLGVELEPRFDAIFERATRVDPRERFGSAAELVDELERAPTTASVSERPRVSKGSRALWIAGVALAVAAGGLVFQRSTRGSLAESARASTAAAEPSDAPSEQEEPPALANTQETAPPAVEPFTVLRTSASARVPAAKPPTVVQSGAPAPASATPLASSARTPVRPPDSLF